MFYALGIPQAAVEPNLHIGSNEYVDEQMDLEVREESQVQTMLVGEGSRSLPSTGMDEHIKIAQTSLTYSSSCFINLFACIHKLHLYDIIYHFCLQNIL